MKFIRRTWRAWILALLFFGPMIIYMILGVLWLMERKWAVVSGAVWAACGLASAYLADRWTKRSSDLLPPIDWSAPEDLSETDKKAWELVREESRKLESLSTDELTRGETYFNTAQQLARSLAEHYHPKAATPIDRVPIVELLTALELASEDLSRLCRQAPGGEMITIGHYQSAVKAADLIQRASDVYMYLLPIAQPISGLARLGAREWVSKPAWKNAGKNLLEWFFLAFVNRLGAHLIELYSGRLAMGAETYRKLRGTEAPGVGEATAGRGFAASAGGVFIATKGPAIRRRIEMLRETAASNLNAVREAAEVRGVRLDPRGLVEASILHWTGPVDPTGKHGVQEVEKAISTADLVIAWIDPECFESMLKVLVDPPKALSNSPSRRTPIIVVSDGLDVPANGALARAAASRKARFVELAPGETDQRAAGFVLLEVAGALPEVNRRALFRSVQARAGRSRFSRAVESFGQGAWNLLEKSRASSARR